MARLSGLGSFVAIAAGVLLGARLVHVAIPLFWPESRPGPFTVTDPGEAARLAGFAPLIPAYRPRALGEKPPVLVVRRIPRPEVRITWRGERFLEIVQTRGGPPPGDGALAGADAVLERGGIRIVIRTDLPEEDVPRLVQTLTPRPRG